MTKQKKTNEWSRSSNNARTKKYVKLPDEAQKDAESLDGGLSEVSNEEFDVLVDVLEEDAT